MTLTAMLCSFTSSARYSEKFISADFDDMYGCSRELGRNAVQTPLPPESMALPLDDTLTILPRRCSIIGLMNCRVTRSVPKTLTAYIRSKSAGVVCSVVTRPAGG